MVTGTRPGHAVQCGGPSHVARGIEELNFYLILIDFHVNGHIWLAAKVPASAGPRGGGRPALS